MRVCTIRQDEALTTVLDEHPVSDALPPAASNAAVRPGEVS